MTMTENSAAVQELLDRAAIEQVLIRYCNGLSAGDYDRVASCFSKEGVFAGMKGREGVRESFANHYNRPLGEHSTLPVDMLKSGTYYLGNVEIEVEGDTAKAFSHGRSRLLGVRGDETVLLVRGFTYTDDLIREDGEWVIKNRTHTFRWMYEETPLEDDREGRRVQA